MNNKKKFITIVFSICLMLLVVGFSYAFFMYGKTGLYTHTINGGKMGVVYNEVTGNNITIDNAYPLTDEEALTKGLEFEFTITGYNESDKNIYYAIEMDHGEDIDNKNRFLDSDMKLSLYENNELIFENEVFENLDNQNIHYNYFERGTSKESPIVNNYKLRIWINDYVFITNTPETYYVEGLNVYSTSEFENSYTNFKVNVIADLTYDGIGYLTYDANGGEYTPQKSSLTTGKVTSQKPVMASKSFLGWSSTNDGELEYKAGSFYNGEPQTLYAVYGNTKNIMVGTWPSEILEVKEQISEVRFIDDTMTNINERYNNSFFKVDLTANNQGSVKGWVELVDDSYAILYIGSEGTTYLTDCYGMFVGWNILEKIDFTNVDTSMVTDMSYMFSMSIAPNYVNPHSISSNNNDDYDIEFLEDMPESNFIPYNYLIELNLEAFNTSNVTDMSYMFYTIGNDPYNSYLPLRAVPEVSHTNVYLEEINLNSFDTRNVKNMSYMFAGSSLLKGLDLDNFNTSNVEDMSNMFANCVYLIYVNLNSFETTQVTDMSNMFNNCGSLDSLNLKSFDTANVTSMESMFYNCSNLYNLDLQTFNTSSVENMSQMFSGCENLTRLELSSFDTSQVTDMSYMFADCSYLNKVDLSSFNTSNVTTMEGMFTITSIIELNLNHFDTSKVINMSAMFWGCNVKRLYVDNFDTRNVTEMSSMFYGCDNLIELNLSSFDTSNVTTMGWMFRNCSNLTYLDISNFTFDNVVFAVIDYTMFGMPDDSKIYVKSEIEQLKILSWSSSNRPSTWTTDNVIIKNL